MNPFLSKTHCDRCGDELRARIMSKFNRDTICMDCKRDETEAPGYKVADKAERDQVLAGNYDFPGIGLGPDDAAFLAERRKLRSQT